MLNDLTNTTQTASGDPLNLAVLALRYHFGRAIMACQVLKPSDRYKLACATEQARSKAETLAGRRSTGPLDLGGLVDDEALRIRALRLAGLFTNGTLRDAAAIEEAVFDGAAYGVIEAQSTARGGDLTTATRMAA